MSCRSLKLSINDENTCVLMYFVAVPLDCKHSALGRVDFGNCSFDLF